MKKYVVVGWNICRMNDDVKVIRTTDDVSKAVLIAEKVATRRHNPKGTMIVECISDETLCKASFVFPDRDEYGEYTTTIVEANEEFFDSVNDECPSGEETKFYKKVLGIALMHIYYLMTIA